MGKVTDKSSFVTFHPTSMYNPTVLVDMVYFIKGDLSDVKKQL